MSLTQLNLVRWIVQFRILKYSVGEVYTWISGMATTGDRNTEDSVISLQLRNFTPFLTSEWFQLQCRGGCTWRHIGPLGLSFPSHLVSSSSKPWCRHTGLSLVPMHHPSHWPEGFRYVNPPVIHVSSLGLESLPLTLRNKLRCHFTPDSTTPARSPSFDL